MLFELRTLSWSRTLVLNMPSHAISAIPPEDDPIHPPELTVTTVGWTMFCSSFLTAVIVFSGVSPEWMFFDTMSVMSSPSGVRLNGFWCWIGGFWDRSPLADFTLPESLWLMELDFSLSMSDSSREPNPLWR